MIFSKLFGKKKRKWQSEKVSERLASVAELETTASEHKSILHELAFNDVDEKVRRAALIKLADFSLWWQAYKADKSEAIQKAAEKHIVECVTDKQPLEPSLKVKFIEECNKTQLLEKVVFELNNESLTIATLQRLNKEALTLHAISDSSLSEEGKLTLLKTLDDPSHFKRLAKKLDGALLEFVEAALQQQKEQAEKPVKLEKQAKLVLAQINSLKDKSDYQEIESKLESLSKEWQQLSQDFELLNELTRNEFITKHQALLKALENRLTPIREAWQLEQNAIQHAVQQQQNYQAISKELTAIEAQVTQSIADDNDIDELMIKSAVKLLTTQCEESDLNPKDKQALLQRAESLIQRANQVPQIKAAVGQAQQLLTDLNQLALPVDFTSLNQVGPQFKQIRNEWQDNLKDAGISLPETLAQEFDAVLTKWQQVIVDLEKQQRQLFNQTRRKLSELESLVKQGKFHNAFGLFKKIGYWMADLNDYQKGQLSRTWETLEQEIGRLQELERSFALPKKQELIAEIKKLAESPLVDPTEQAHRVRMLRSNWQTLGHLGEEQEEQLNHQFDEYCEAAFSTCREHYKMLEDERNANYEAKLLLITQLETLAKNLATQEVNDWREVESMFVKLTRLWRETGLIDREKVAETNQRYQNAVAPIKKAISDHQKQNLVAKEQLVAKAKSVVENSDDMNETIETLKQLQNEWKQIGFAGKGIDQKLWNQFREINNPVFEQRAALNKEQKEQNEQEFNQFNQQLEQIETTLAESNEISQFRAVIENTEQCLATIKGIPKNLFDKLRKKGHAIIKTAEQNISLARAEQEKQVYTDLFIAVEALANGQKADLASLKPAWQSALNNTNKADRLDITLMLEIAAGVESPESDSAKRSETQMAMMSSKLEQGINYNVDDLLEQWLSAGAFQQQDIEMMKRIQPIFVS